MGTGRSSRCEDVPVPASATSVSENGPHVLIGMLQQSSYSLVGGFRIAPANRLEDVPVLLQAMLVVEVGARDFEAHLEVLAEDFASGAMNTLLDAT